MNKTVFKMYQMTCLNRFECKFGTRIDRHFATELDKLMWTRRMTSNLPLVLETLNSSFGPKPCITLHIHLLVQTIRNLRWAAHDRLRISSRTQTTFDDWWFFVVVIVLGNLANINNWLFQGINIARRIIASESKFRLVSKKKFSTISGLT